jgi:hypothetical protein
VLSALGILKEVERDEEHGDKTGDEAESFDPEKVGHFCAGLARVVVPMIRALHKGPAMLQATMSSS